MVSRHRDDRTVHSSEELRRVVVLPGPSAVGKVAARDDQLGLDAVDQRLEPWLQPRVVVTSEMQVRNVQDPCP